MTRFWAAWLVLNCCLAQPPQPGTKWTEEQLRGAIEMARAGRKLTPKAWPNHARVAVCLSFDTDTEAPLLRDGNTSATSLSAVEFGAESGMPRILRNARQISGSSIVLHDRRRRHAAP